MSEIEALEAEAAALVLPAFSEETALRLGLDLVELARADGLPVVINVRTADRTLFHAALPGSSPENDAWARRKSNVALHFHAPSLLVGARLRAKERTLACLLPITQPTAARCRSGCKAPGLWRS